MSVDERDINLPPADLTMLAGVRDERQRELLKGVTQSNAYKQVELVARLEELERENRGLRAESDEARRAIADAEKANEKLRAAESARAAAERVAEKEGFARLAAEARRDELIADLREANEAQSRIERLLAEHDTTT